MAMAVVDVGKVLVFVGDPEVAVLGAGQDLDGLRTVVRIVRIDRVHVLEELVSVQVPMVARGDHEDADE
jgi:hypothetical protein